MVRNLLDEKGVIGFYLEREIVLNIPDSLDQKVMFNVFYYMPEKLEEDSYIYYPVNESYQEEELGSISYKGFILYDKSLYSGGKE